MKLVDFGIAKARSNSSDTEIGVLKGKVAYMAPEQAMGGAIDRRADIFAMGVVLWELLAGKRLMSGDSNTTTFHRVGFEPIAAPSLSSRGLDPYLDTIALKALNRDPAERFQTAAAMREALIGVLARHNLRHDAVTIRMSTMFEERRAEIAQYIMDASGDPSQNVELSKVRARKVEAGLGARGIHAAAVDGFGPEMPVASNATEPGREKNRRVEVWLEGALREPASATGRAY